MLVAQAARKAADPAAADFAQCYQLCFSASRRAPLLHRYAAHLLAPCFCIALDNHNAEALAALAVQVRASAVYVRADSGLASAHELAATEVQQHSTAVGRRLSRASKLQKYAVHMPAAFAAPVCAKALAASKNIAKRSSLQHIDIDMAGQHAGGAVVWPVVQEPPRWLGHVAAHAQLRTLRVAMHADGDWAEVFAAFVSKLKATCKAATELAVLELSFETPAFGLDMGVERRLRRASKCDRLYAAIAKRTALTRLSLTGKPFFKQHKPLWPHACCSLRPCSTSAWVSVRTQTRQCH